MAGKEADSDALFKKQWRICQRRRDDGLQRVELPAAKSGAARTLSTSSPAAAWKLRTQGMQPGSSDPSAYLSFA
jgi:hypothetical protein